VGRSRSLIRAAGGVVWRDAPGGPVVALVHRPKHGDWSLPKGKLEKGESFPAAALREVSEETGCRASLGQFVGHTLYEVRGRPKVVMFWNMFVEVVSPFRPTREIDDVAWLDPMEALGRLDHPEERRVLLAAIDARAERRAAVRPLRPAVRSSRSRPPPAR
jgi:8-oxo-dGTP pyrophosphatase MutT (NUDIX family)